MVRLGHDMKRGDSVPQIIPIKELKNTAEVSELCHKTDEPVYITKNGYGDMVIMSMDTFDGLYERLQMYKSLMTSEQDIKEDKVHDARETISSVKEKYGL